MRYPIPPKPPFLFPFPIHIGTDICRIPRIARLLRPDPPERCIRFVRRILDPVEVASAPLALKKILGFASAARRVEEESAERLASSRTPEADGADNDGVGECLASTAQEGEEKDAGEEDTALWRAATFMAGRYAELCMSFHLRTPILTKPPSRFAAKEAAFKAHPHLHLGFHDVLILPMGDAQKLLSGEDTTTKVMSVFSSRTPRAPVAIIRTTDLAADGERSTQVARISISHDGDYATAVCMGFEADYFYGEGGRRKDGSET
jgi:holo-[acyl-carrier protein] synthase